MYTGTCTYTCTCICVRIYIPIVIWLVKGLLGPARVCFGLLGEPATPQPRLFGYRGYRPGNLRISSWGNFQTYFTVSLTGRWGPNTGNDWDPCSRSRAELGNTKNSFATLKPKCQPPKGVQFQRSCFRSVGVGWRAWGSIGLYPRGSKYPTFKDSGPKNHKKAWFLEPDISNIGYWNPLGMKAMEPILVGPGIANHLASWLQGLWTLRRPQSPSMSRLGFPNTCTHGNFLEMY